MEESSSYLPPATDIIAYPFASDNKSVILSVSEKPYSLRGPVSLPLDLYVESFQLKGDLITENTDNEKPARFGIFTNSLLLPREHVRLGVRGAKGAAEKEPPDAVQKENSKPQSIIRNGRRGGILECFVQRLDLKTVQNLGIDVSGGHGYSQLTVGSANPGGDGGDGGTAAVLFGSTVSASIQNGVALWKEIDGGAKNWPSDFTQAVHQFYFSCDEVAVKDIGQMPEGVRTAEAALKTEASEFKESLQTFLESLLVYEMDVRGQLSQGIKTDGGYYGTGSPMGGKLGTNGAPGSPGSQSVKSTNEILDSEICFAHPAQCRMLLDRAKLHYYSDSYEQSEKNVGVAECMILLKRLLQRLAFLEHESISDTKLGKAYRNAESRLAIPSGPRTDEPASIKELRAIRDDATAVLAQAKSGRDYYNHYEGFVPRGTFQFYKERTEYFLKYLREAEKLYAGYLQQAKELKSREEYTAKGQLACQQGKTENGLLIKQNVVDLYNNGEKIKSLTGILKVAKEELMKAVDLVITEIKQSFQFPFKDLVDAMGQVIMVHGAPMAALQGISLLHEGATNLTSDDGVKINKDYLIRKVRKIGATVDSLHKGFQQTENGTLEVLDPGAEKLQISENDLRDLLEEYSDSLRSETLKTVNQKFQRYTRIALDRNSAVLNYNACVLLWARYDKEKASLEQMSATFSLMEKNNSLDMDCPTIMVYMEKLYVDWIMVTQLWLYRAQRAYNYEALNRNNIIGSSLRGLNVRQYNSHYLSAAQAALFREFGEHQQRMSHSRQRFSRVYQLDDVTIDVIQSGSQQLCLPMWGADSQQSASLYSDISKIFSGMADIRLTKIRFFLDGVQTANGLFKCILNHSGKETMTMMNKAKIEFTHDPVEIMFCYNIENRAFEGTNTSDGDIKMEKDEYASVGPFTTWTIYLTEELNPGLVLDQVTGGSIEFIGEYRAVS